MAQFRSKPFGVTKNGDKVDEYIISNPGGLEISVLNYGCVIKNLFVPTKTGPVDVVVGHDTLADYEADFNSSGSTCCGAFVGRYANRIENAEFSLSGKTYKLEANNGKNHLHGTFPRKIYDVKMFGDTLLMETESPAGEDGFPGNLKVSVRYILTPDNTLRMDYRVSTDEDTIINLTNHTYFNLDGGGNVLGQKLRIYASNYLEGNNETCPTGKILPVDGTPMDFRTGKPLGRDLDTGFYQTTMAGGGWTVTAAPDGTLTDAAGQTYNYLYWEGTDSAEYDLSHGFCVAGSDTAAFLENALRDLGLTRKEANEFIVYWLPQMQENPYNLIAFQSDCYTQVAQLDISPAPDTLLRVFMAWKPLEEKIDIPAQTLTAPARDGFTAVEWGGNRIN